jgi:hypothetical protein
MDVEHGMLLRHFVSASRDLLQTQADHLATDKQRRVLLAVLTSIRPDPPSFAERILDTLFLANVLGLVLPIFELRLRPLRAVVTFPSLTGRKRKHLHKRRGRVKGRDLGDDGVSCEADGGSRSAEGLGVFPREESVEVSMGDAFLSLEVVAECRQEDMSASGLFNGGEPKAEPESDREGYDEAEGIIDMGSSGRIDRVVGGYR